MTALLLFTMVAVPVGIMPGERSRIIIVSLLGCALVALAAEDKRYIATFGIYPFFAWAGSPIYLAHLPILNFVWSLQNTFPHLRGSPFYYVASVTLSALAAELTFRFVEKPSHAASRRISLGFPKKIDIGRKPDGETEGLAQQSGLHARQMAETAT